MVLNKFFKSLSVDEDIKDQIQSEMILDNVIGIMSVNGGAGASTIVANVGHILSKYNLIHKKNDSLTDMVVCIVDFNVFNPMQYQLLSAKVPDKGVGLQEIFISGTKNISPNLIRLSNTLSLVTASPNDDIYEYFDVTTTGVNELIVYLKEHFDVVLIDIPNQIASPLCYETIKCCSKTFLVWDENISIYQSTKRLLKFFKDIKIRNKFTHIIFNKKTRTSMAIEHIEDLAKKVGLKLLTIIPYSQDIVNDNLNGTLYVEQGVIRKDIKKGLMKICSEIIQIKLSNIVSGGVANENLDD